MNKSMVTAARTPERPSTTSQLGGCDRPPQTAAKSECPPLPTFPKMQGRASGRVTGEGARHTKSNSDGRALAIVLPKKAGFRNREASRETGTAWGARGRSRSSGETDKSMAAIKSDEKIREEKGGNPTERRAALLRAGKGRTCS